MHKKIPIAFAFLHVVTPEEEVALGDNRLCKLLPFTDMKKKRCLEYYQPIKYLCIDERMILTCHLPPTYKIKKKKYLCIDKQMMKSKSRSHLVQYMRNRPVKWGLNWGLNCG